MNEKVKTTIRGFSEGVVLGGVVILVMLMLGVLVYVFGIAFCVVTTVILLIVVLGIVEIMEHI